MQKITPRKPALLRWGRDYTLGIGEMDRQHEVLVIILDDLYTHIYLRKNREDLKRILDRLSRHVKSHFANEERYFDLFRYDNSAAHKKEHIDLLEKTADFNRRFNEGKDEITEALLDFLEDWMLDHVDRMDRKYVACFRANGVK
jgi:hemerythrin